MAVKKVYSGKVIDLSVHNVVIEGRQVKREIIGHPGAAAIVGVDEKNRIILVRQHRYPHGYTLEIPAGTLEPGEDPKECAKRELLEETGYRAKTMSSLLSYYPSIGYSSEIIHCYTATGLKKIAELNPDNDEFISVVLMDLQKLIGMIKSGKIQDSKTICGVLTYTARKKIQV